MSVADPNSNSPRRWYQKKRTYAALILTALLACALALVLLLMYWPTEVVLRALDVTRAPVTIRKVEWQEGALTLRGVRVGKGAHDESSENVFFSAARISVRWHWVELLLAGRIASVELRKPQIWVARLNKAQGNGGGGGLSGNWSITSLKIDSGTLMLDNLGADIPAVPITVGREKPVEFRDVRISGTGVGIDREQVATVEKLTINSPYDPMSPVLFFDAINVTFTWEELRRSEIRKVELIGPIIYLGPDLFWFTDRFGKQRQDGHGKDQVAANSNGNAADETATPWKIHDFQVRAGKLAVNAFGQPGVTLPFTFVSSAKDIRLDQLDKISINNKVIIPSQDRFYPEYKIRWREMRGEIAFSLPLGDKNADNVVNTIHIKSISWNDLEVTDAWSSVTFDRTGIYGRMEGHCYKGLLTADFAVLFQNGYPWEGHFFVMKVDSEPMIAKLAPAYLSLNGILNGKLAVKGRATEIVQTTGDLKLQPPGVMQIKSVDQLIQKMPADWNFIKRDLITIALESFRTYNYTKGELTLDYQNPTAVGKLSLSGLQGERNFTVNWHQEPPSSEVAKPETKR